MLNHCPVCNNEAHQKFSVREMMFGFREHFEYAQCSGCGLIYQVHPSGDLSKYYPENYYSQQNYLLTHGFKRILKKLRGKLLFDKSFQGLRSVFGNMLPKPPFYYYIAPLNQSLSGRILDVGCGSGQLLYELSMNGFKNLTGIDPYLSEEKIETDTVRLFKKSLAELHERYDAIMLNHALEHMNRPLEVMLLLNQRLNDRGKLLLRIPVVNYAWEKYGINWIQLDAPRHMCVFSEVSMQLLAKKSGFNIEHILYDSSAFQFWGSEQYQNDIPLRAENSFAENPKKSIFTKKQILQFEREANELNKTGRGDQACFYLKKISET